MCESVLNRVLCANQVHRGEGPAYLQGTVHFGERQFPSDPATGLQTEEIYSFRLLTRRHMASEPSSAVGPATLE